MILTRFCSLDEYRKFMAGETLTNDTHHSRRHASTSVGFCFTADDPRAAWRYLKGIVKADLAMVLDIPDGLLTPCEGRYTDYSSGQANGSCIKKEYCLRQYSNKSAKLLRIVELADIVPPQEVWLARMMAEMFD